MKRILSLILAFILPILLFTACSGQSVNNNETTAPTSQAETETAPGHMLDGKRIIFVGNSYTYYGNAVIAKGAGIKTQAERINDQGYFYQICKANGADVEVTNWTFGSHGIGDLFDSCTIEKYCDVDYQHTDDLTNAFYDYVFLQDRSGEEYTTETVLSNVQHAVDFFRAANPDVKIFFFAQSRLYEWNVQWLPALQEMENQGVTVLEWGALVEDVISGKATVANATQQYARNSFIINQSASDGYHPNMLTGYITAQMAYCAITGESAVGQPYSFCTDSAILYDFDASIYIENYYKNGANTNMLEIFRSPDDMQGLQALIDQYLAS